MKLATFIISAVLTFSASTPAQLNGPTVAQRGDAAANFFGDQEIRLLVWNTLFAAHHAKFVFDHCGMGRRQAKTTVDSIDTNAQGKKIGILEAGKWPARQKIWTSKVIKNEIENDGSGTPDSAPGGGYSGGGGNDTKYVIDAFLGAIFHEFWHVWAQNTPDFVANEDDLECETFAQELLFYHQIKDLDPCYAIPALRRVQLCNRIEATKKLANKSHNCGF